MSKIKPERLVASRVIITLFVWAGSGIYGMLALSLLAPTIIPCLSGYGFCFLEDVHSDRDGK
jgi:hypothetical protein